ncbi:oocyte zinc finger protein XlCOF7.1-like, partial [Hyla sarda]|uniref:oocyte zinc finger protein XlCOF7.1-like n=1 Tax=Hyla sarda TaxID=327740 RepID=UPI0024C40633
MMKFLLNTEPKMEKEKNEMTKGILNLTLEIIYQLTGEDYTIVKKTSSNCATSKSHSLLSGERSKIGRIHERNNEQKILELTHKMMELLTGEVPIRCQDVTVYFSMEEWEYIEGHKDLYQDIVMMEDHRPRTSPPDGSRKRNPPERCPAPLHSQDCPRGDDNVLQDDQLNPGEDLIDIKIEVIDGDEEVKDQRCKEEEISVGIGSDMEDAQVLTQSSSRGNSAGADINPQLRVDPSAYVSNIKRTSPGQSPAGTRRTCMGDGNRVLVPESEDHFTEQSNSGESGRPSPWESYILDHQRRYTGDKAPPPDDGKRSPQTSHHTTPQRTNTGPPQFLCLECGKWFTQESDLSKHQKIHTGEKPFSCSECGKSYAQKSGLFEHQKLHTGKKPFSCSDCGRCFTRKSSLVEHGRIHTGEKPFVCLECGKCFTQESDLS